MMDKLDYLEKQMTQYQASNAFGSGMVRVSESQLTPSRWDKEVIVNQPVQTYGSWQYWATLQLSFINAGDIIPPYMAMIEAEINGIDIYKYPWFGQVSDTYSGQLATCGSYPPHPSWNPEFKVSNVHFLTISVANFPAPPTARYKLRLYCPYEVTIQILHENKR